MTKPNRKQLIASLKEALKKEQPRDRRAFLRAWQRADAWFRRHRVYDKTGD